MGQTMEELHLTRISGLEMALSLKNDTEGKCLPQTNNKIQNSMMELVKECNLMHSFGIVQKCAKYSTSF